MKILPRKISEKQTRDKRHLAKAPDKTGMNKFYFEALREGTDAPSRNKKRQDKCPVFSFKVISLPSFREV